MLLAPETLDRLYRRQTAWSNTGAARYIKATKAGVSVPPFTMACRCWITNKTSDYTLMVLSSSSASESHFLQAGGASGGNFQAGSDNGTTSANAGSGSFTAAKAYLVMGVWYANNSRTCYASQLATGSNSTSVVMTAINQQAVGAVTHATFTGQYVNGVMWEPVFWNRALSFAEFEQGVQGKPLWEIATKDIFSAPLMNELFDPFLVTEWARTSTQVWVGKKDNRSRLSVMDRQSEEFLLATKVPAATRGLLLRRRRMAAAA